MSTPLEKAQAALQAKRKAGELEKLDPLEKSARNPQSLADAIKAMCWECVGRNHDPAPRKEVANCSGYSCPLWDLRPWQQQAPKGFGLEKRQAALAEYKHNKIFHNVLLNPVSRRKAINAKCFDCSGLRGAAKNCPSKFPRSQFGLDEPTGYRGCPLWPHRPNRGVAA